MCDGQAFFAIEEVNSPDPHSANQFHPLGIAGVYDWGGRPRRRFCALEAWVCKSCSYTELYAKDLALLERLAAAGDGVRTVESRQT